MRNLLSGVMVFTFLLCFVSLATAQSPAPLASPSPHAVIIAVNAANDHLPAALPIMAVSGILLVLDFVARKWPSSNPIGILHFISGFFSGIAAIFKKLADYSDQIISQNISKPS